MIFGLVQLLGALAAAVGLYLLLGLAPTLLILGGVTFVGAVVLEIMGGRRPQHAPPPPTGGGVLEGLRSRPPSPEEG